MDRGRDRGPRGCRNGKNGQQAGAFRRREGRNRGERSHTCHLLHFGLFATPERNLIFDMNDFDETLPAPWEWDVKRLAASFVVAYADQNERDHARLVAAVKSGRIKALVEVDL